MTPDSTTLAHAAIIAAAVIPLTGAPLLARWSQVAALVVIAGYVGLCAWVVQGVAA